MSPEVSAEAERLQRCCAFAAECQVTASGFWANIQLFLGATAAALAAISSGSAFSEHNVVAGILAATAALAAAVLASLRPGERAESHQKAAGEYHRLAVDLRLFREFGRVPDDEPQEAEAEPLDTLTALEKRVVALDQSSPWVPRRLAKKTQGFVRKGRAYYDNEGTAGITDAAA